MLRKRLATAFIILSLIGGVFWLGPTALLSLALLVFVAINWEFFGVAVVSDFNRRFQLTLFTLLIPTSFLILGLPGLIPGTLLALMVILLFFVVLSERQDRSLTLEKLPATLVGLCYTGLIGSLLVVAAKQLPLGSIAWLMSCVIFADTAAYFGGRSIGGTKLAPFISPNKTVSGAVSGLCGCMIASAAGNNLLHLGLNTGMALIFGLLVGVLAIFGDLVESAVKRLYQVKDMGSLLPGHGGVLDRVDAFLFALPVIFFLP